MHGYSKCTGIHYICNYCTILYTFNIFLQFSSLSIHITLCFVFLVFTFHVLQLVVFVFLHAILHLLLGSVARLVTFLVRFFFLVLFLGVCCGLTVWSLSQPVSLSCWRQQREHNRGRVYAALRLPHPPCCC